MADFPIIIHPPSSASCKSTRKPDNIRHAVIRSALSITSIGVSSNKSPFIQPLLPILNCPLLRLSTHNVPNGDIPDTHNESLSNLRSLVQVGQQASPAFRMNAITIDVCCASQARIHDLSSIIWQTYPRFIKIFPSHLRRRRSSRCWSTYCSNRPDKQSLNLPIRLNHGWHEFMSSKISRVS